MDVRLQLIAFGIILIQDGGHGHMIFKNTTNARTQPVW